jgi:hypothetical protein
MNERTQPRDALKPVNLRDFANAAACFAKRLSVTGVPMLSRSVSHALRRCSSSFPSSGDGP